MGFDEFGDVVDAILVAHPDALGALAVLGNLVGRVEWQCIDHFADVAFFDVAAADVAFFLLLLAINSVTCESERETGCTSCMESKAVNLANFFLNNNID